MATLRVSALLLASSIAVAGCAGNDMLGFNSDNKVTTASVAPKPQVDPACTSLSARIETLRKDGVEQKVDKAAARKYTLKRADIAKVNELTKANAEFQSRCSTVPRAASTAPSQVVASAPVGAAGAKAASGKAASAKAASVKAAAAKPAPQQAKAAASVVQSQAAPGLQGPAN